SAVRDWRRSSPSGRRRGPRPAVSPPRKQGNPLISSSPDCYNKAYPPTHRPRHRRQEGSTRMDSHEAFHVSDPAVVARYLQLRSLRPDRRLARVDLLVQDRSDVLVSNRLHATLVALLRNGYARSKEGEVWPVVFLTPIDVTLALCVQIN